jgi:hypothetical protein
VSEFEINADGRWRPERELNGHWIACRYVISRSLARPGVTRDRDGRWWKGELLPSYHMTLAQCEARCAELNGPAKSN